MKAKIFTWARSLALVASFLALAATCSAQNRTGDAVMELQSWNCEIDEANFNVVRSDALERLGEDGVLIAIARPGIGDKARDLNRRRLGAAKKWLGDAGFPTDRLVLAEGERVSGGGRVEFYVGGRLTHVILPKPNVGLCTECCNPRPEDFSSNRRRKRHR